MITSADDGDVKVMLQDAVSSGSRSPSGKFYHGDNKFKASNIFSIFATNVNESPPNKVESEKQDDDVLVTNGHSEESPSSDNTTPVAAKVKSKRPSSAAFQGPPPKKPSINITGKLINCTACGKQLNQNYPSHFARHPQLNVLLCRACYHLVADPEAEWSEDASGFVEQCSWCGTGGTLCLCDSCKHTFCTKCIKRNTDRRTADIIINGDSWKCFLCDPGPLRSLRELCDLLFEHVEYNRYTSNARKRKSLPQANRQTPQDKSKKQQHSPSDESGAGKKKPKVVADKTHKLLSEMGKKKVAADNAGASKKADTDTIEWDAAAHVVPFGQHFDFLALLERLDKSSKNFGQLVRLVQKTARNDLQDASLSQVQLISKIEESVNLIRNTIVRNAETELWALEQLEKGVAIGYAKMDLCEPSLGQPGTSKQPADEQDAIMGDASGPKLVNGVLQAGTQFHEPDDAVLNGIEVIMEDD